MGNPDSSAHLHAFSRGVDSENGKEALKTITNSFIR